MSVSLLLYRGVDTVTQKPVTVDTEQLPAVSRPPENTTPDTALETKDLRVRSPAFLLCHFRRCVIKTCRRSSCVPLDKLHNLWYDAFHGKPNPPSSRNRLHSFLRCRRV